MRRYGRGEKIRGLARDRRLSLRKLEAQAGLPQARLTKLKGGGYLPPGFLGLNIGHRRANRSLGLNPRG
jgi:hypothetical protein